MALHTYDAKEVSVVISDRTITGFNSITVDRAEDSWIDSTGADGEVARSKSNDKRGNIELNLQQTSSSNEFLSSLHNQDEASGNGTFNILVRDNRGTSLHESASAWILKPPASEYAQESGERVWTIRAASLSMNVGGN
jgi:hypothetical protein